MMASPDWVDWSPHQSRTHLSLAGGASGVKMQNGQEASQHLSLSLGILKEILAARGRRYASGWRGALELLLGAARPQIHHCCGRG